MHLKESKGKYIWGDLEEGKRRERYCNYIIISNKNKRPWIWARGHRKDLREKREELLEQTCSCGCPWFRPASMEVPGLGSGHLPTSLRGCSFVCASVEVAILGLLWERLLAQAWFHGGPWLGPALSSVALSYLLLWRLLTWACSGRGS